MNQVIIKRTLLFFVVLSFANVIFAQPSVLVKPFLKSTVVISKIEDTLKKQFEKQKIKWPAQSMYLRSFKYDKLLEVWVKGEAKEAYKLRRLSSARRVLLH
jgi:hypothetical protein